MGKKYDFQKIEKHWQAVWRKEKIYEPDFRRAKNPFYNLMMFPYPSAEGLHVGNMFPFTGSDVYGRFKRMQGYDVFEPIGLDGFGIHSENYALRIGAHPMEQAKISEKRFYKQLETLGDGFAWNERLETYDPDYYKWTQWIFVQMFKHGLAYRKKQPVNWCPSCKTVLADEQVIAGKCERCSSIVIKKELEQWFFKITKYAERLLKNLDHIDWSDKVKISQRNWIGKSQGAEIRFELIVSGQPKEKHFIEVFTTRPDTLFGATFLVIAPEFAQKWLEVGWKAPGQVKKYVKKSLANRSKAAEENTKKTGVFTGVYAINPANKEKIPVWVADYVLMGYGTGAIMAVPAHDERDVEFAKKYKLPIKYVIDPVTASSKNRNPQHKKKIVALVENEKGEVLTINWGKPGGRLFIGGTIEQGEDPIKTAKREIAEETGYHNLQFLEISEEIVHHEYFSYVRKTPFIAHTKLLYFRLKDGKKLSQILDDTEKEKFLVEWVTKEQARKEVVEILHRYAFDKFIDSRCYEGEGILANSEKFSGLDSETAKWKITEFVNGRKKVQYRLRDWLISRQRYWGPPIPLVFCEGCKKQAEISKSQFLISKQIQNPKSPKNSNKKLEFSKGELENPGWITIPEKDLPVRLPFVKDFQPKGKGESPLGTVQSFYETTCPKCKGKARRETDVSDTFLDSAWYFLRYPSVREKNNPWSQAITKKWLPVHMYIGGAEHSVLHLLYSRFVTMAFHDFGMLHFEEPFTKFRAHGLLIKEGAKMSKSKGNIVNPDEYVKKFGADTLRMYLMFLAPFEQGGDFRDGGILGIKRFLERVWKLCNRDPKQRIHPNAPNKIQKSNSNSSVDSDAFVNLDRLLHRTIKKVGEDIEHLRYNTAISALMILLNEMEKSYYPLPTTYYLLFLKLLAPFAPHITEEIWSRFFSGKKSRILDSQSESGQPIRNYKSIHLESWPKYDPKLIEEKTFTLIIQMDGKVRDTLSAPTEITEKKAQTMALDSEKIKRAMDGKKVIKIIYVPRRLVNIVTES